MTTTGRLGSAAPTIPEGSGTMLDSNLKDLDLCGRLAELMVGSL